MILEAHVYEELSNIVKHQPLPPGDTISHRTANECIRRGWAAREENGNIVATKSGKLALEAWFEVGANEGNTPDE